MVAVCVAAALANAAGAAAAMPPDLAALAGAARITASISRWCPVRAGVERAGVYAVAVPLPSGGGRFLVLGWHDQAIELARFVGPADLSCYTPAEARQLDGGLRETQTVLGGIKPEGSSSVICGFVEPTSAVCWQYSATVRAFVTVGRWTT